jgi:hypothetical protein
MDEREVLFRKADRCRRLALTISDDLTRERLRDLAQEYEAEARTIAPNPERKGQLH